MTRPISPDERALVLRVLELNGALTPQLAAQCEGASVAPLYGEGDFSLHIGRDDAPRDIGATIACAGSYDTDGVYFSIMINVDTNGDLFELDIWKDDFLEHIRFPTPESLRIPEES